MKKLTLALLLAGVLAGCASFPDNYEKPVTVGNITQQKQDEWSSSPAVTFVQSNAGMAVRKYDLVPPVVRNKPISFDFTPGTSPTLSDIVYSLGQQGFRVVPRLKDETLKQPWQTRHVQGTVGEVLDDIVAAYNVGYEYRNGTLYLVETNKFSASLPKNKDFLEGVSKALKEMGGTDVRYDMISGAVYYSAKPDDAERLENYLNAVGKNAAMVNLQVAVLTVGMNRNKNIGFDWSQFAIGHGTGTLGAQQLAALLTSATSATGANSLTSAAGTTVSQPSTTGTSTTGTGTTGTTGTTSTGSSTLGSTVGSAVGGAIDTATGLATTAAQQLGKGSIGSFSGATGLGYQFASNRFSLNAAINALSTYGNARTEQNVVLATLSGIPSKINSGDDIPYVKSVGAATAAGGATTGSSETDTLKTGLKLEVTPQFDATNGMVTTHVKVDMSTLVGFIQLSAGTNLGTMSQPQTKELGFETEAPLTAGETIIVGGITYDQSSNNFTNLPGLEKLPLGSQSTTIQKTAMYIVVRPTVTIYTPYANELNARLAQLEAQAKAQAYAKDQTTGQDEPTGKDDKSNPKPKHAAPNVSLAEVYKRAPAPDAPQSSQADRDAGGDE
ncbi:hypothetical protein QZN30_05910 [Burkholderia multivorans]|nr:hypothetical protein [Burkholderia multivorans]